MRYCLKKIYNNTIDILDYASLEEAKKSMENLCALEDLDIVALLDKKLNTVVCLFHFEGGKFRDSFWDGDIVKFRKEYCELGEEKYVFRVTDINENTSRCLITCENSGLFIPGSECVGIETIEKVK